MSYFIDHKNQFLLEPPNETGLRNCQLGAIWALKSYFTAFSNEVAALISMPTGSGKTALMMATCFELRLNKVLIVVPSEILRWQIYDQFRNLNILKEKGCIPRNLPQVNVYEVTKRQKSREDWIEILRHNDVIVAHPNSISPYFKNLSPLPFDLIDAVFIDEAHHEPAPTWKAINDYYISIKRIFFTATPFRRDRKRMRAKLVYHYPLAKALEEGILRPVRYRREITGLDPDLNNQALIRAAREVFDEERAINPTASILVRTDRIEDAKLLVDLYKAAGFIIDTIHSERSPNVNSDLVSKVKNCELDGLVCVGIASEGLDIPNLKIAVLHATPRSIPYTIQFLGRISRQPIGQEGSAILIANQDEVRGEVSRLYKSDEAWNQLIPEVFDERMRRARHFRTSSRAIEEDFQMPEINVFFSALIYETFADFRFEENFDTVNNSRIEILHLEQDGDDSPLIIITKYDKPLEWASRDIYIEDLLDIHIYYHHQESHLLFELTTSEIVLNSFKENLITSRIAQIPHGRLFKVLSEFNQSDYIMVGMKNATMHGASQPSYKIVIGSGVQSAVRAAEGRVFSAGHALLKLDETHTWGLATKRGRVWAMKRGTAEEFKVWCDNLAMLIQNGPISTSLPGLSFLARTSPVNTIEELPIAIIPDDIFFRTSSITIQIHGWEPFRNMIPIIEPMNIEDGVLHCIMKIDDFECDLSMDFSNNILWSINSADAISVRADRNENIIITKSLSDILNEYPPTLIMGDGSVIEGRNRIIPNREIEELPASLWKTKDWSNCDITSERYDTNPAPTRLPVINKTVALLQQDFNPETDLLILDDGANEIADLILFKANQHIIQLIHCKASSEVSSGCRRIDSDILFAQVMRSIHWVSAYVLLDRINERLERNSRILLGNLTTFVNIRDNYRINEWTYSIIAAQPGFRITQTANRTRANNNIYELAIPMHDRVLGSLANLEIWGS